VTFSRNMGGVRFLMLGGFAERSLGCLGGTSMEMHQVRYFLALCEEKQFTRAALRCGVAQPSLTNAIRTLETELGGTLFHRTRTVQLTDLGQSVKPYLRQIARSVERARREAARLRPVATNSENASRASRSDAVW
jgi:DNA-binding transcriptional LysR family regulator